MNAHKADTPTNACGSADLIAHPDRVASCPLDRIPGLLARIASEQAALAALQTALAARLVTAPEAGTAREPEDRLLTAADVATALGVTIRWVQRRARRLPFARKLSEHAIRYSEAGLRRWMAHRRSQVG
jgi:predicted DNA-binding transcriptional regulator AlpA